MIEPLRAMLAAARAEDPALGAAIVGLSCHRDPPRQAQLYCSPGKIASRGYAGQAFWVAPPGYSEHATGLSLDFGDRNRPDCHVEPCFAETRVGRWLAANASRFGFRLSFPPGNAAGVAAEPWHYRYTGGGIRQMQVPIAEEAPDSSAPDSTTDETADVPPQDAPPPAIEVVPLDPVPSGR
jgi:D-alanyl-D-alanine carboxypeptidase